MSVYRIKQFLWAITSSYKKIDYNYVRKYLNNDEYEIFNLLSHSDKHHSIRVCKDSLSMMKEFNFKVDKKKLGKVALLHDIGKITYSLNVFEKSIIVLLDRFTKSKLKNWGNIKQIEVYYNHSNFALDILEKFNYDDEMIYAIRDHHSKNLDTNNNILNIIRVCDNKN